MRRDGLPIIETPRAEVWVSASARALGLRLRNRMRRSVALGSGVLTVLALLTGVGAGAGAVAFRYLMLGFTYLFTGHRDYSAVGHASNPLVPGLGIWFVVAAPVSEGSSRPTRCPIRPGSQGSRCAGGDARGQPCSEDGSGRKYPW